MARGYKDNPRRSVLMSPAVSICSVQLLRRGVVQEVAAAAAAAAAAARAAAAAAAVVVDDADEAGAF